MADIQTEKAFQKQDGINTYNKYLLLGAEQPTKKVGKKKNGVVTKKNAKKMSAIRYFKKVGLGFNTPYDAISGTYVDKKCPFTGNVSIRGRIIRGMVASTKMKNTIEGELQPFFEIHDSRYMMYWLALDAQEQDAYMKKLAADEAARQALEARTVDKVMPGEQQPETDHRMETDDSQRGSTEGVFYRDARDGHYFSYLMKTGEKTSLLLQLTFWGQDEWRSSEFDIYVDDQLLASVNNTHRWRTTQFKTVDYELPASMLEGKKEVRIKFVAHKGKQVGQIYGVRLLEK